MGRCQLAVGACQELELARPDPLPSNCDFKAERPKRAMGPEKVCPACQRLLAWAWKLPFTSWSTRASRVTAERTRAW